MQTNLDAITLVKTEVRMIEKEASTLKVYMLILIALVIGYALGIFYHELNQPKETTIMWGNYQASIAGPITSPTPHATIPDLQVN